MSSVAEERVARSVALEKAYVHDVYEQFSDGPRGRPWPKVNQFLADLEPGSLVCDVGKIILQQLFSHRVIDTAMLKYILYFFRLW